MGEPGVNHVAGFYLKSIMEFSKDFVNEFMKLADPHSIFIIGRRGQLQRLYCPFTVIVVSPVGKLVVGDVVAVEAVKITLELKDVYIIEERAYYIIHFRIFI